MSDRFGAMRAELLDAALRELAGADWLKANDWIALNNAIVLAERVGDRDAAAKVTALVKGAMGAVYGRVPSDGEAIQAVASGKALDMANKYAALLHSGEDGPNGEGGLDAERSGAPAEDPNGGSRDAAAERTAERPRGQEPSGPRVKDPAAPASKYQLALIDDLVEHGIATAGERAALGASPTKGAASALIDAHSSERAFTALMDSRRAFRSAERAAKRAAEQAPQATAAQGRGPATARSDGLARVGFPAELVSLRNGCIGEFARFQIPEGVSAGGRDLGGLTFIRDATDRLKAQLEAGGPVTATFSTSRALKLYDPAARATAYLDPGERGEAVWELCSSVKDARGGGAPAPADVEAAAAVRNSGRVAPASPAPAEVRA